MDRSRSERIQEFFRRLRVLPRATSLDGARRQIEVTLHAVEDELTPIPRDPATRGSDGRMYPPEDDAIRVVPGRPDLLRFRSRSHNTYLRMNGAMEIREVLGDRVVFEKAGADGRKVWGKS